MINDENVYILNSIQRYNTQHRVHVETVAAHSFFVTYFINRICTGYELDDRIRLYSLEAGMLHDLPEVITNDITHDAKQLISGLSGLLKPYEEEVVKSQSERAHRILFSPTTFEEQIANAIVNHADVLSVYQYCETEVKLGNRTFREMLNNTVDRMNVTQNTVEALVSVYKAKQRANEREENKNAKEQ
jgi:5'-deoxynucleotidase YfbR-like HD superfamily hydrolase